MWVLCFAFGETTRLNLACLFFREPWLTSVLAKLRRSSTVPADKKWIMTQQKQRRPKDQRAKGKTMTYKVKLCIHIKGACPTGSKWSSWTSLNHDNSMTLTAFDSKQTLDLIIHFTFITIISFQMDFPVNEWLPFPLNPLWSDWSGAKPRREECCYSHQWVLVLRIKNWWVVPLQQLRSFVCNKHERD